MEAAGIELRANLQGNSAVLSENGAEAGALNAPADPDLARIITAWARLPVTVRAGITAMIDRAETRAKNP